MGIFTIVIYGLMTIATAENYHRQIMTTAGQFLPIDNGETINSLGL
jgi:hypothetical protein